MDKLKVESKQAQSEQKPAGTQRSARTLENLACQQELLRHVSGCWTRRRLLGAVSASCVTERLRGARASRDRLSTRRSDLHLCARLITCWAAMEVTSSR